MMLDSPAELLEDAVVLETHPLVTSSSALHDAAMTCDMTRIILEAPTP